MCVCVCVRVSNNEFTIREIMTLKFYTPDTNYANILFGYRDDL